MLGSQTGLLEIRDRQVIGAPKRIRIAVTGLKGRCPRPLDDGGMHKKSIAEIQPWGNADWKEVNKQSMRNLRLLSTCDKDMLQCLYQTNERN